MAVQLGVQFTAPVFFLQCLNWQIINLFFLMFHVYLFICIFFVLCFWSLLLLLLMLCIVLVVNLPVWTVHVKLACGPTILSTPQIVEAKPINSLTFSTFKTYIPKPFLWIGLLFWSLLNLVRIVKFQAFILMIPDTEMWTDKDICCYYVFFLYFCTTFSSSVIFTGEKNVYIVVISRRICINDISLVIKCISTIYCTNEM